MANSDNADVKFFLGITTPLAEDTFEVLRVSGTESISAPYELTIDLAGGDVDLDFAELIGKPVGLNMRIEGGADSYRHGLVTAINSTVDEQNQIVYTITLRPWLWMLTRMSDFRIFQNKSVPDIVSAIFQDLGFNDVRTALEKTYAAREYCTQHGESTFDFVSRLLEDEGIYYFFEHTKTRHMLVLADTPGAFPVCPAITGSVALERVGATWEDGQTVSEVRIETVVTPNEYRATDYNFKTPATSLDLTVTGATGAPGVRSIYEYPGGYMLKADGDSRATRRIEEVELGNRTAIGRGYVRGFVAGHRFTLQSHFRNDANIEYVVRTVRHSATQEDYANTFEAFPASQAFHPPRTTPRPHISGYEIATVVGKAGEEIWTDEFGRIKVTFPWDRRSQKNETSSCWIRVSQMWAGKSWGTMWVPRIGTEVVVAYLDGDPDRPLVIGTLFNGQQTTPYTLPDDATKSTIKTNSSKGGGGSNELRFEDKKDAEEIYVHAQKDINRVVENDEVDHVKNARQVFIKTAIAKDDAAKDVLIVEGIRTVTVKGDNAETHTNEGEFTHKVTKNFTLKVDGDTLTITAVGDIKIKGKSISLESTGGDIKLKSAMNIASEAGAQHTSKAQAKLSTEAPMIESKATGTQTVDGGGMLIVKGGLVKIN